MSRTAFCFAMALALFFFSSDASAQSKPKVQDGKNTKTGKAAPLEDPDFKKYGIYANSAPRPSKTTAIRTRLPLKLEKSARIALVGNTLLDRSRHFGYLETFLHQRFPLHRLVVRNLSWSADTSDIQPRPANFADLDQHLTYEKADVIIAAFGFNESFAGQKGLPAFREKLIRFVEETKTKSYNGKTAPQVILLSPIANENVPGVNAATLNNANIKMYAEAIRAVAAEQNVGFADVYSDSLDGMNDQNSQWTFNGCHLTERGYRDFSVALYKQLLGENAPKINESLRQAVIDKNRQYFRRFRPLNTFYYTGGRNKSYGYLDFLPAMKNFDIMVANREQRIWSMAAGKEFLPR